MTGAAAPVAGDGTYMGFVGVTTGQSSIRQVFPAWAAELGLPTGTLVGHDVPLGSQPQVYRDLVARIRDDPQHRGALVTTHKVAVHAACADMFDELDDLATTFGEISSIYKRDGRLCGAAKDPVTVRRALEEFLPGDHFAGSGAEVLVLGARGSGMALSHQRGGRADRPARVTCTALRQGQLDHLRELHERAGLPAGLFRYVVTPEPARADELLAGLPPGSLVVNATGMGKDVPGSPFTDAAVWPDRGLAWEFNYRGSLEFLHQARDWQANHVLTVEDGWRYFVHGWTQVIADVFDVPMPHDTVAALSDVASAVR